MKPSALLLLLILSSAILAAAVSGPKALEMWAIDTEGGKALLILSPSGQSMLVDTGNPGNDDRDTRRILAACRNAGVERLDVLLTTHYDVDHVANTPSLVSRIPVALFVDHGPPLVADARTLAAVKAYDQLWARAKHLVVSPGDRIPMEGVEIRVVAAGGQTSKPAAGKAGQPNPACEGVERRTWTGTDEDRSENAASVGALFTFGSFRMLDLGDLTWNHEMALVCPDNQLGEVDLFMASHHGLDMSNNPALLASIRPRVAIMNNGERKGGAAPVIARLKSLPGLQALYLLHWSANAPDDNPPDAYIANLRGSAGGSWLKVSARENGTVVVTNGRTGESRTYTRVRSVIERGVAALQRLSGS